MSKRFGPGAHAWNKSLVDQEVRFVSCFSVLFHADTGAFCTFIFLHIVSMLVTLFFSMANSFRHYRVWAEKPVPAADRPCPRIKKPAKGNFRGFKTDRFIQLSQPTPLQGAVHM